MSTERELICMISADGKSDGELAHAAWLAYQAWLEAKASGRESFQPVLDLS